MRKNMVYFSYITKENTQSIYANTKYKELYHSQKSD